MGDCFPPSGWKQERFTPLRSPSGELRRGKLPRSTRGPHPPLAVRVPCIRRFASVQG